MWALGEFLEYPYPLIHETLGAPVFEPSTPIVGDPGSYYGYFNGRTVLDPYPYIPALITIPIPRNERWEVTVSLNVNRISTERHCMVMLVSGNAGYPGAIVDTFVVDNNPATATDPTMVTVTGLCSDMSALLILSDARGGVYIDSFSSDRTFVENVTVPTWVLGDFWNTMYTELGVPNLLDPDSGLSIFQHSSVTVGEPSTYRADYVRVNPATPIVPTPDPYQAHGALTLNIPENEIWNVSVSGNIDRIDGNAIAILVLMRPGNPYDPSSIIDIVIANPGVSGLPDSQAFELTGQVTAGCYVGLVGDPRGGVTFWQFDSSGSFVSTIEPEIPEFNLTWWEPGSKTYERGVDRGVLYFDDGRVVPWNGLTKVDEQFGIESEAVYFDGVKLSDVPTNDSFFAQVSAITYPDQLEEAYGNLELRNGVYLGEQAQKSFGFTYRNKIGNELTEDAGYKIHIVYNVTALPSSRSYSTIDDSFELTEFSWDFKTTPETALGYQASAHVVIDTSEITPSLLTELEQILYGTPDTPPYLPTLAELIALIDGFNNFINITDNGDGTWTASTSADGVINDLGSGVFEIQHATIQVNSSTSYLISPTPDPPDN